MKIFKRNGYISAWGDLPFGDELTENEYNNLLEVIGNKPSAESGYDYRLTDALEWERYELPIVEETETTYTAEQLSAMTNAELSAICTELGISGTMTKANMIALILDKQNNIT